MLIVMGHLVVAADDRDAHLALSLDAVQAARATPGCLHFAVTADPVEQTWVDIAEVWTSRSKMDAFRTSGDAADEFDPFLYVREFHVEEFETTGVGL